MNFSLYDSFCKWAKTTEEKGVVVASDEKQEWLLPWWLENYEKHNSYPVSFIDFGMSKEMKEWCKKRGNYIPLFIPDVFVTEKKDLPKERIENWERSDGELFWENRNAWFKKPLACLQSPYAITAWIDSDCEIRGDISHLFSYPISPSTIVAAKEDDKGINSGVLVFEKPSPLILEWAKKALTGSEHFLGDQDLLSHLIASKNTKVFNLPPIYNWSRFLLDNPKAIIMHWQGSGGKQVIAHQAMKKNLEVFN